MKSSTQNLIDALRVLSREIYCEDGAATAVIAEAADRLEEMRMTDAERDAVLAMACHCDTRCGSEWVKLSATLRGLLSRTGSNSRQASDNAA